MFIFNSWPISNLKVVVTLYCRDVDGRLCGSKNRRRERPILTMVRCHVVDLIKQSTKNDFHYSNRQSYKSMNRDLNQLAAQCETNKLSSRKYALFVLMYHPRCLRKPKPL
jgi:hypothetical protein